MVTVRVYPSVGVEEPGTEAESRSSLAFMNPPNDVSSRHLCAPASLGHVVIGKDGWGLSVCLRVPRCEYLLHTGDGNRFQPREMGGGFRLSEWFLVPQSPESVHSMHRRWLEGILTSRGPSGPGLWTLGSGLWGSPGGRLCEAGLHSGGGHAVAAEAAAEQHWQPVAEPSSRVAQSWDLWLMSQGRVSILQQL